VARLFEDADERSIESRVEPVCHTVRQSPDPAPHPSERTTSVSLDRLGRLLDEDVVALPFDRQLLDLEGEVLRREAMRKAEA